MKTHIVAALAALVALGSMTTTTAHAGPLDSILRGFSSKGTETQTARSVRPPLGYQVYCLQNPKDCRGGGADVVQYTSKLARQLAQVNQQVNRQISFKSQSTDVWRVNVTAGDCEDYALTKRQRLIRMGVPASALRMAVVRNSKGEGHAVLVVKTSKGELVLDNARQQILPRSKTGYRWLAVASSNPGKWSRL